MSQYRGQEAETDAASAADSYNEAPTAAPPQPPPNEHHPYPYPPPAAPYDAAGTAAGHDAFGPRQPFNPAGAKMPPRFNPAISQPPTPTLNQLLQSNSPMNPHRYQNNYPEQHYNQWPPQKGYGPGQTSGPYRPPQPYGSGPPPSGYDNRTGWPGGPPPPGGPHHGPGSPNQSQAPAPPPQGQQPPSGNPSPQQPPISHSPGPGPGPRQMPPSPQQQSFSNRPQPPTTPNAHAPDAADLSGGNSNDSCGGPAPGTPNSQNMRPTPSPTGSTGSRSMSPAVGQNIPMPPRPSSGQSDGGGPPPGRISQSPMPPAAGGYGPPSGSQQPPYQGQPYSQPHGGYPPRPQGNYPNQSYGAAPGSQPPMTNNIPSQQFSGRTGPPNHMQSPQFPYQHGWQASGQKGGAGPQNAPNSQNPNLRPPHYLKHHLQHKLSFGNVAPGSAPPSPGPPQNFHMGPPPSGMAPPSAMGPPTSSPLLPNSHPHEGPMPPPSSTPNSHMQMGSDMVDNSTNHVSGAPAGSVTSIITTGPDGTPLDEGSQQSTLSNASAASGEDPVCPQTPKSGRKGDMSHYGPPPQGGPIPSPGSASMNSMHEEYNEISSPNSWSRTPASPVFNSHVPTQDTYRSKKTDSLSKLYEMDDNPDRRGWLDKLLAFMDDRRSPITTCPTISKNPLDLFRLYMYVKDRGGFMEVTKNKTWKDIAGLLGIGASSSAAYTLRKHYTKNLLPYECQFDRGGIDPQPIINQVEATSKKKGNKQASVPSPGSSNSQDSFPPGGGMDGYVGYNGYPNNEYPQRPASQSAPSPHGGSGVNHMNSVPPGGPSPADNVSVSNPFDDVAPSPPPRGGPFPGPPYQSGAPPRGSAGQNYPGQQGYQGYPGPGAGQPDQYPPYSGAQGDSSNASGNQSNNGQAQDPYNRYPGSQPGGYGNRPPYGNAQGPGGSQSPAPYQDYYRSDQNQSGGGYPGITNKNMPPPSPQPPRRHPDFAKDQPFPPYGQPRQPMYGGWPNNNQYRPPQYGSPQTGGQQWQQGVRNGGPWPQPGQQWQPMAAQGQGGPNAAMRPVHRPGKPFPSTMPPGGQVKGSNNQQMNSSYGHGQLTKREITFPPDSVENVTPVLFRRKRICRTDVGPVDAWRLLMCLRSGLLTESTYALDMLNILLFDDSSVGYFGLNHWPGLLDLLLEQFKKHLSDMFDPKEKPKEEVEPDLGAVTKPIEPTSKTLLLNRTKNYSMVSRKEEPVKHVECPEDIFVTSATKDWDVRGDANIATMKSEQPTDPWSTNAEHILPSFQAEFGNIPFHMTLKDNKEEKLEVKKEKSETQTVSETTLPKSTEKKRARAKTLSDVISRIKKDSEEIEKNSALQGSATTTGTLKVKTENPEGESVDLNVNLNGECGRGSIGASIKRRRSSDYEDESYTRDEASLVLLTESHDNLGKRCMCLSNILRSLTFIPGNELEFARNLGFLALVGKVLLLHHEHPARTQKTRNYDREEDTDFADSCSSLQGEGEWWWDFLTQIRENILVCLSNIAGQIDISLCAEEVARPVLDGLLHWAICPSATAQDPFISAGPSSLLSPQRLALEALCKLCVTNCNVDLVIATPPFARLEKLCAVLTKHLCRSEDQVLREFSINLLHYLAAADSSMARVVALQSPCISLLVAFIEQAEQSALEVANQRGIGALRDNPDSMGTSLDMLRRAAATLVFLSRHPDNKPLMMQQESRLLALVMSQILDQQVALLISKVLFQISRS